MALIHHGIASTIGVWSIFTVMSAVSLAIAGFINMGIYRNTSAIGVWAGLGLFVPILTSAVAVATRQRTAVAFYLITHVLALAACTYSTYLTYDDLYTWDTFRDSVNAGKCTDDGIRCTCPEQFMSGYYVGNCNLYGFGWDLCLSMMILSICGAFACLIAILIGLTSYVMGTTQDEVKRRNSQRRHESMLQAFDNDRLTYNHSNYDRRNTAYY